MLAAQPPWAAVRFELAGGAGSPLQNQIRKSKNRVLFMDQVIPGENQGRREASNMDEAH
jgi:hypothetical protein